MSKKLQNSDLDKALELALKGKIDKAQGILNEFEDKDAEWHYVQGVVYRERSWFAESRRELELACQSDPNNETFSDDLNQLQNSATAEDIPTDQPQYNEEEEAQKDKARRRARRRLNRRCCEGGCNDCCNGRCCGCKICK